MVPLLETKEDNNLEEFTIVASPLPMTYNKFYSEGDNYPVIPIGLDKILIKWEEYQNKNKLLEDVEKDLIEIKNKSIKRESILKSGEYIKEANELLRKKDEKANYKSFCKEVKEYPYKDCKTQDDVIKKYFKSNFNCIEIAPFKKYNIVKENGKFTKEVV